MRNSGIIINPLYSEKSLALAGTGCYTFKVANNANKYHIKQAIKDLFDVEVTEVATLKVKGTLRTLGKRRTKVMSSTYKKAFIKLKKGQKLTVFDLEKSAEPAKKDESEKKD